MKLSRLESTTQSHSRDSVERAEQVSKALFIGSRKLGGELGEGLLLKARGTVIGVMLGIVGTAAAQGTVAMIGFLLAGVPGAVLLGFSTFFLSMIPVGPPLIWGGAAAWLYTEGQTGWAIFMVLYGLLVISFLAKRCGRPATASPFAVFPRCGDNKSAFTVSRISTSRSTT